MLFRSIDFTAAIMAAYRLGATDATLPQDRVVAAVIEEVGVKTVLKGDGATAAKSKGKAAIPLEERCCARLFTRTKHVHPKGTPNEGQAIDFLGQEVDGVVRDEANKYGGLCRGKFHDVKIVLMLHQIQIDRAAILFFQV